MHKISTVTNAIIHTLLVYPVHDSAIISAFPRTLYATYSLSLSNHQLTEHISDLFSQDEKSADLIRPAKTVNKKIIS